MRENIARLLEDLQKDIIIQFDKAFKEESSKMIKFSDYVKEYGVPEVATPDKASLGVRAEEFVRSALTSVKDIRITNTTGKIDKYYGADFKLHSPVEGKASSVYVDVKLNTRFETGVRYLHHNGDIVDDASIASVFPFSFGKVYFGIKERHHAFFRYEKPVVIMYIQDFKFSLQEEEMNTLAYILTSLNRWMLDREYPYRASQKVMPNRKLLK